MRPLVSLVLLVCLAPAAPVPKGLKAKKDDTELMAGLWIATTPNSHSFEYLADGTMRIWNGRDPGVSAARYGWKLDPTASPKRMTWYGVGGTAPQYECVYELDGDDLKITYESAPKVPTAIGSSGQNHTMTRKSPPAK